MIPSSLLIHTCTIVRAGAATGADAYGVPTIPTTTTAGVACRFVGSSGGRSDGGTASTDSGARVTHRAGLLPPSTVAVAEGDRVTGDDAGYARTYLVKHVKPIYGPKRISHYRADLEAVA